LEALHTSVVDNGRVEDEHTALQQLYLGFDTPYGRASRRNNCEIANLILSLWPEQPMVVQG